MMYGETDIGFGVDKVDVGYLVFPKANTYCTNGQ